MKIADKNWDVDTVIKYVMNNCSIDEDNYRQIVLYTGLFEWPDGTLHDVSFEVGKISNED